MSDLVKKIEAVKIGLEVFGVEKRITELENRPIPVSGSKGGGGAGVTAHSALTQLDYASAGHTGFQPAGSYLTAEVDTLATVTARENIATGDIILKKGQKLIFDG